MDSRWQFTMATCVLAIAKLFSQTFYQDNALQVDSGDVRSPKELRLFRGLLCWISFRHVPNKRGQAISGCQGHAVLLLVKRERDWSREEGGEHGKEKIGTYALLNLTRA